MDAGADTAGVEGAGIASPRSSPIPTMSDLWSASPGVGVDGGASCTFGDPAAAVTTVSAPTTDLDLTLSADDGTNPPVLGTTC